MFEEPPIELTQIHLLPLPAYDHSVSTESSNSYSKEPTSSDDLSTTSEDTDDNNGQNRQQQQILLQQFSRIVYQPAGDG